MKYRLKDRELQAKLDELTNGAFSKNLHPYDETLFASYGDQEVVVEALQPGKRKHREPKFGFWFTSDEVELVPRYDPHAWNEWPAVEPPAMTAMRIEADDGTGIKAFWDEGWRRYGSGVFISCPFLKFRPWED